MFAHEEKLTEDGLEKALPALLYFTENINCSIKVEQTHKHQTPSSAEGTTPHV